MTLKGQTQQHKTLNSIPTRVEYEQLKNKLSTNLQALVMVRLAAETGITRIELATIKKENLDTDLRRLYLPRSKAIKDKRTGGKWQYKERNRYVPVNSSLMPLLLAHIKTHDSPYIFIPTNRYKKIRHLAPQTINNMFIEWSVPWSPHKFRHYFRSQVRSWMLKERQVDMQVIKEMMGHSLNQDERYGGESPHEYKLEIVDSVF